MGDKAGGASVQGRPSLAARWTPSCSPSGSRDGPMGCSRNVGATIRESTWKATVEEHKPVESVEGQGTCQSMRAERDLAIPRGLRLIHQHSHLLAELVEHPKASQASTEATPEGLAARVLRGSSMNGRQPHQCQPIRRGARIPTGRTTMAERTRRQNPHTALRPCRGLFCSANPRQAWQGMGKYSYLN
jgi:hypothetical protein